MAKIRDDPVFQRAYYNYSSRLKKLEDYPETTLSEEQLRLHQGVFDYEPLNGLPLVNQKAPLSYRELMRTRF